MENTNFKRFFLAPVLATALVGAGYGISKAVKTADAPATTAAKSSEIAMVPANFTELAEKVRPGVVNIQVVKRIKNVAFGSRGFSENPFDENNPFGDFFGRFSGRDSAPAPVQRGVG